jgi:hypothetical protein
MRTSSRCGRPVGDALPGNGIFFDLGRGYDAIMRADVNTTAIYLVCFHSEKPKSFEGSKRQYREVETAIDHDEWPYDNGDDPSFYVARQGGRLTWGVCRQDLRSAIAKDSIVVFFSFTPLPKNEILYRLCAVATVDDKLDHRAVQRDHRLSQFRHLYINGLITPENVGWRYDETDRRSSQRHKDWLWRIACHRGVKQEKFNKAYADIYDYGRFSDAALASRKLQLAENYVVFSSPPDRAFISPNPPEVALAAKGEHERWMDQKLQEMTVGTAAALLKSRRDYLRVANKSGRNVHRQIRFEMVADEASRWRDELIAALKGPTDGRKRRKTKRARAVGNARC